LVICSWGRWALAVGTYPFVKAVSTRQSACTYTLASTRIGSSSVDTRSSSIVHTGQISFPDEATDRRIHGNHARRHWKDICIFLRKPYCEGFFDILSSKTDKAGTASVYCIQQMSTILQSLRTHWKYQGLGRFFLLATRKISKPILAWDVHYIFQRALSSHASIAPAHNDTTIRILKSEFNLAGAPADLITQCPMAGERLRNGQVVVVALADTATIQNAARDNLATNAAATSAAGASAKAAATSVKTAPQTRVAGYTWITFSDIWLPEFDLTMMVRPGEMVHYDSFVSDAWRGQGLHTGLILVAKQYALSLGCTHSLSWISMFNVQSLKTAQRLVRKPDRPMIVVSVKFRGMKRFHNAALQGSLGSRFKSF
jgi:GNAT superfamily N-acetyltransferase